MNFIGNFQFYILLLLIKSHLSNYVIFFQEIQIINASLTVFDVMLQIAIETPQFKGQRGA